MDEPSKIAALSAREYKSIRDLLYQWTGINLGDNKRDLVVGRLSKRLRQLNLSSWGEYMELLTSGKSPTERTEFINSLTTNKTEFFRESHHFDLLRDQVQTMVRESGKRGVHLRIWSAGCSSGEEPYSIAMALTDLGESSSHFSFDIIASDIDTQVLGKARSGVYSEEILADLTPKYRKYFEKDSEGMVRVVRAVREHVEFRQVNLIDGQTWPKPARFDFIFCRNVVIYFDAATQSELFDRFATAMVPNGTLFIGHSESLKSVCNRFELFGTTAYKVKAFAEGTNPGQPVHGLEIVHRNSVAERRGAETRQKSSESVRVDAGRNSPGARMTEVAAEPVRRIVLGEVFASKVPFQVSTLLGSCVATCLFDPTSGIGGMNHFLLPSSDTDPTSPARYGIHAMELLINEIMKLGGDRRKLQAKLFGAASVINVPSSDVSKRNAAFARQFLAAERIPVLSEKLGGTRPMEVRFFTHGGRALFRELAATAAQAIAAVEVKATRSLAAQVQKLAGDVELF